MTKILCVDLSEYQRGIRFDTLQKEGVKGVILRGGDGRYLDVCFAQFYEQAAAVGLAVGAYWFSRARSAAEAEAEAERFYLHCLKGRRFALPIYLDCEADSQRALGKRALTDVILRWSDVLRKKGFLCGVYSTAEWFRSYMLWDELAHLERWVAQWSSAEPSISYGMWQFGGETNYLRDKRMAGYIVDQNYMVRDYPALIRQQGYNGFLREVEEMRYETLKELKADAAGKLYLPTVEKLLSKGILKGKGGSGDALKLDLGEDAVRLLVMLDRSGIFD